MIPRINRFANKLDDLISDFKDCDPIQIIEVLDEASKQIEKTLD